jgi:hypothetical protein
MKKGKISLAACLVALILIPALVFSQGGSTGTAPKGFITLYWDQGFFGIRWNPDTQHVEAIISLLVYEDTVSYSVNFYFFVDEQYFELKMAITSSNKGKPLKRVEKDRRA